VRSGPRHRARTDNERNSVAEQPSEPPVADDVSWQDLDRETRAALRSLPKAMAERVGGHLAMAGVLVDDDPETARAHADVARRLAGRVAVVREAAALTAYACGDFDSALAELRAYRRLSGDQSHLPLMADCERGLGRPERALELCASKDAEGLPEQVSRELRIVAAGARRDLGQDEAALALLASDPALTASGGVPDDSVVRLRYAYADTLERLGRRDEARAWFARVADQDAARMTDAQERLETSP
jgi:tetratricopeptide (TPR) repeat protein